MSDALRREHAESFAGDIGPYLRSRPGYPDESVDWLVPPSAHDVVDLGAGTGGLTRSLAGRGLAVTAVEPSATMRAALRVALPGVRVLEGTGEAVPLRTASADAVFCAQAWHWVDPAAGSAEVARVLRPGGRLGLIWHTRDESGPWGRRLGQLLRPRGEDVLGLDREAPDVRGPLAATLEQGPAVAWTQWVDVAALVDLVASRSYVLVLDQAHRDEVLRRAADLGRRWAAQTGSETGSARLGVEYITRSWRAQLP